MTRVPMPRTPFAKRPLLHTLGQSASHLATEPFLASQIDLVPIGSVAPYKGNARLHDERQIKKLVAVIREVGFMVPMLVDEHGTIVAGHGRLEAAKQIGMCQVPVIRASHLSPEQIKAFRLAENKLGDLSSFDQKALALELKELAALELEIDILDLTAFETAEIDLIIASLEGTSDDAADQCPELEPGPAVSRLGDLWQLGQHRLVCGSALDEAAYARLMDGVPAQASFADPPYNVPIKGHVGGRGRTRHREFVQASGEMSEADFIAFLQGYLALTKRHCADGALIYACMDAGHGFELLSAARGAGLTLKTTCTWAKTNAGMGSLYRVQTEFVHVFKSGAAPHINTVELGRHGRSRTTLWNYPGVNTFRKGRMDELGMHPTVKPVALVVDAIKDCTHRGDIVLDPFVGSGTTLIAAERAGRVGRGIELDPGYVDVVLRRWEAFTGCAAIHEQSGKSFAELAREREGGTSEQERYAKVVEVTHG